jgi:hypothetical protein
MENLLFLFQLGLTSITKKKYRHECLSYFQFVGSPPALSPSLAGSYNIGDHKGRRFCYANSWFAT